MSPFTCFSLNSSPGGYQETIRAANNSSRTALSQLQFNPSTNDFGSTSNITATTNIRSSTSVNRIEKRTGNSHNGNEIKRKSNNNNNKRVSKDMIGLPRNFIHVGHVGKPLEGSNAALELQATLDSVTEALSSSSSTTAISSFSTTSIPTPRILSPKVNRPTQSPPFPSTTNKSSSSTTSNSKSNCENSIPILSRSTLPPSSPIVVVKRKPPPPITASVILSAGPKAVLQSSTIPPPLPLPSKELVKEVEAPEENDFGIRIVKGNDGEEREVGNYMTETTKKKWDVSMRAIEEALKL